MAALRTLRPRPAPYHHCPAVASVTEGLVKAGGARIGSLERRKGHGWGVGEEGVCEIGGGARWEGGGEEKRA